jgi:hypothetical protein
MPYRRTPRWAMGLGLGFVAVALLMGQALAQPTITLREQTGLMAGLWIEGSGLTPGQTYRLVTRGPNGRELGVDSVAGSAGTVVEVLAFDATDPDGVYTIELRDRATGEILATTTFERQDGQLILPDASVAATPAASPVATPDATPLPGLPGTGAGGAGSSGALLALGTAALLAVVMAGLIATGRRRAA